MTRANAARAALGLTLAAVLALTFANREAISETGLRDWLASAGLWAPLAFVALYALATVLFLPGSVLTLAAGALFGVLAGALYSLVGATLGAALAGDEAAVRNGLLALALAAALMFLPRLLRRSKAGQMIRPDMLRSLQATGGIALVDVRDAKDIDGELGRVPDACNIPLPELAARIGELAPWREGGVVLICRTQVRSRQATRLLAQPGFLGLRLVQGVMQAWRRLDLPTAGLSAPEVAADTRQRA